MATKKKTASGGRWSEAQASAWAERLPWLVGCNYTPRTACNQLEFWQAATWDPFTIDQELGWAASLGFNSLRVFLHDLVWRDEGRAYLGRIDQFLGIAERHGIGAMLVFFDSCWHPFPRSGPQMEPERGVHNSRWVQSPGVAVLRDARRFDELEGYVSAVVERFREDERVHVWDLWNEPDNPNAMSYGPRDLGNAKGEVVLPLLTKAFGWARAAQPTQPLTSGIWIGDWDRHEDLSPMWRAQLELSDVVSFHWYGNPKETERRVKLLSRYNRPLLCTEYMARVADSTFAGVLPVFRKHRVGAYNWGFVEGRTQTHLPWPTWQEPVEEGEPAVWFHDVLRSDGTAYDPADAAFLKKTLLSRRGAGNGRA